MKTVLPGALILTFSQLLTLYIAFQQKQLIETTQVELPEVSAAPALVYFFAAVAVLGLVLYLVRHSVLKIALKIWLTFILGWGVFTFVSFSLALPLAVLISLAVGLAWLFFPKIWLHDLLLSLAAASVASVLGFLFSPWTVISIMLVISVYDILAVRFGFMVWMVKRMSAFEAFPAFFIPGRPTGWTRTIKKAGSEKFEGKPEGKEFAILGGGDVIFPLLLGVSVFSVYRTTGFVVVEAFSLLGLISAFWIERIFLKGKPMAALPPISLASLVGLLIVYAQL